MYVLVVSAWIIVVSAWIIIALKLMEFLGVGP